MIHINFYTWTKINGITLLHTAAKVSFYLFSGNAYPANANSEFLLWIQYDTLW